MLTFASRFSKDVHPSSQTGIGDWEMQAFPESPNTDHLYWVQYSLYCEPENVW